MTRAFVVESGDDRSLRALASWRYEKLLAEGERDGKIAIAVEVGGSNVALAILRVDSWGSTATIEYFRLVAGFASTAVFTLLIDKAVDIAREHRCRHLEIVYENILGNRELDTLLDRKGWSRGSLWKKHYYFDHAKFQPKWLYLKIPLPEEFAIVTWSAVTPAMREQIARMARAVGAPQYMTPLHLEEYRQEANTLLLARGKEVVGWSATHTFPDSSDRVDYSSLFLHPLWRSHGYAIALLAKSIQAQPLSGLPLSLFEVALHETNESWKKFVEERLEPYAQEVTTSLRRHIAIDPPKSI